MTFSYDGFQLGPFIGTPSETVENTFYWDNPQRQTYVGAIIDGATRDNGNSTTDVLRAGLLLGQVYSTGKLKQWNPAATDGTQFIYGILDNPGVKMQMQGTNKDRWRGTVMVRGHVRPSRLLIPGNANFSIIGDASEYIIRAQLAQAGFLVYEEPGQTGLVGVASAANLLGGWRHIQAKTGDYTLNAYETGTLFTTRGAGAAVTFTLPNAVTAGLRFGFYNAANQNMAVAVAGSNDTLVALNDLTADSLTFSTANAKIGCMVEVMSDGTGWLTRVSGPQFDAGPATAGVTIA